MHKSRQLPWEHWSGYAAIGTAAERLKRGHSKNKQKHQKTYVSQAYNVGIQDKMHNLAVGHCPSYSLQGLNNYKTKNLNTKKKKK